MSTSMLAAAGGGLDDSYKLHHLLNLLPASLVLSQPWKWGRGNTDTRPKRTRSDYKESLIVFCIVTMQKEKESPWQPLQKTFSRAGLEVRKEDFFFFFFFSFWCLGCSEPVLYQHGCRMQVNVSLSSYVDICT